MYNFDDARKLDIALAAERYSIKWRPGKKSFMFSKGTFEKLNLENCSFDLVFLQGEIFLAVQPGDLGTCMKSRSGTKKSRNITPATYAEKLHDSMTEKGWGAGSLIDVQDEGLVETGELKGAHMYLVVNKSTPSAMEQAAEQEDAPVEEPAEDVPEEEKTF